MKKKKKKKQKQRKPNNMRHINMDGNRVTIATVAINEMIASVDAKKYPNIAKMIVQIEYADYDEMVSQEDQIRDAEHFMYILIRDYDAMAQYGSTTTKVAHRYEKITLGKETKDRRPYGKYDWAFIGAATSEENQEFKEARVKRNPTKPRVNKKGHVQHDKG